MDDTERSRAAPAHLDTRTISMGTRPEAGVQLVPEAASAIQVEIVGGPMDGKRAQVTANVFSLGRGEQNDMPLPLDLLVSTCHARITGDGQHYWLEDLDSKNGTFVGGEQIHGRVPIGPGTLFIVGETCLEFMPR